MKAALQALNQLVADGVVGGYAIGGAIGASFYIQAMQTEDVDAFVFLPVSASGLLTLSPVYEALKAYGEWPLQILTDANPLLAEAIREANSVEFDGVPTHVFRPEHLCAVAIQTGRSKDFLRLSMFLEQGRVDRDVLWAILTNHGLTEHLWRLEGGMQDASR